MHVPCGEQGELRIPGEKERVERETVTLGTAWIVVCSQIRAPLCLLFIRIYDQTISWTFLKATFCSYVCSQGIYFHRRFEHMLSSLNVFFRKRTRIYLGKN